ncbi:major capsid hexamer protein [Microbacterium phage SadLad]|nr:major capsid hexamer protein [Microbacterium phage SadLad]
MRFQMPETLEGLDLEAVNKLRSDAITEANTLNEIPDDKITKEQTAELVQLVGFIGTLSERQEELGQIDATAEQLAAARAALGEATRASETSGDPEGEDPEGDNPEGEGEGEDAAADAAKDKELVVAGGAVQVSGRSFGAKVAKAAAAEGRNEVERDIARINAQSGALSLIAAANVPGFNSEQVLDGFGDLAKAYAGRAKAFSNRLPNARRMRGSKPTTGREYTNGARLSDKAERYGVARLEKAPNEFTITESMSTQDAYDLIMRASSEARFGGQSLIAAGGWCSPSDIVYGFLELETAEGMLDIAEIGADHGGIQFTKGPQLGGLLVDANLGWIMTEAQAEAGTFTKPVFDIECPDWDEVRMDAVGYALRAGLLTDATYPQLLQRYLALALIVHARRMNALTIQRIGSLITTTSTFATVGTAPSITADLLDAIELNAMRIREQYSMGLSATLEAVFPLWVKMVVRSDLSRRTGVDMLSVTDQQITNWFTQRQIRPQFVRDYQAINGGALSTPGGTDNWQTMPNKVEFMVYPAGSFVKLATNVIDLDTVYDQDNLTKNQFLAAFYEEGFAIANTGASGIKVTVNLPNRFGYTGFPAVGTGAGINFAPAAP